jgi:hypothetical protein
MFSGDLSTFPAVKAGRIGARQAACQTFPVRLPSRAMINRSDIIWLGVAAGVMGSLVGGILLGIGMDLIVNGQPLGWLLLLPAAPLSAGPGYMLARKLAGRL